MEFRGKSLPLIQSFLNNRKQFVSINGFEPSKLNITCGVPGWSTIGPLLFHNTTLVPDGIFHWQPILVLLGLVAPVATADSI